MNDWAFATIVLLCINGLILALTVQGLIRRVRALERAMDLDYREPQP